MSTAEERQQQKAQRERVKEYMAMGMGFTEAKEQVENEVEYDRLVQMNPEEGTKERRQLDRFEKQAQRERVKEYRGMGMGFTEAKQRVDGEVEYDRLVQMNPEEGTKERRQLDRFEKQAQRERVNEYRGMGMGFTEAKQRVDDEVEYDRLVQMNPEEGTKERRQLDRFEKQAQRERVNEYRGMGMGFTEAKQRVNDEVEYERLVEMNPEEGTKERRQLERFEKQAQRERVKELQGMGMGFMDGKRVAEAEFGVA